MKKLLLILGVAVLVAGCMKKPAGMVDTVEDTDAVTGTDAGMVDVIEEDVMVDDSAEDLLAS